MNKDDVVLVTGANSGMGKATALALAKTGAQVVMLCRHPGRGQAALEEIRSASNNKSVMLMLCDLASIEDICRFADAFRSRYSTLSVLINNAGILASRRQLTKDGYELNFGVNYLGHFLLTNLLLDLIIPAKGRIVTLSSVAHKIGSIHFDDINLTSSYGWLKAYSQSKLANVLFTYELALRLKETGATANCLHPGVVATNIIVDRQTGLGSLTARLMKHFFISPEQGAETAIYLATSPEVQGVSGQYFRRKQPIESSQLSYDLETAVRLWDLSERMAGLSLEQAVNAYSLKASLSCV